MDRAIIVNSLLVILLAVNLLYLSIEVTKSCSECNYCEQAVLGLERYAMYNETIEPLVRVNGVYFHKGYYCVWTQDRTLSEIDRTDCHEVCHALINEDLGFDKEHFCK